MSSPDTNNSQTVRLTAFSHGAGCGCKIAPAVLDRILASQRQFATDPALLVGNSSKDDAAAYDIGNGQVILSTTDFFMPIADDPFDFGRIAATNAISDIYAMGGRPLMAIAILGWPIDKLSPEIAGQVVDGGRQACSDAGIVLAGGHSIDCPEPVFGLAVTGLAQREHLKQNNTATDGCLLYLTKPLGVGVLTTAQKQNRLKPEHEFLARDVMCQLNKPGLALAQIAGVKAMTDVTGFGLMGHLLEMCEGSDLIAELDIARVPVLPSVRDYLALGCVPGGTLRNHDSYGHRLAPMDDAQRNLLCDPQTSGGLLIAVLPESRDEVEALLRQQGVPEELCQPIGELSSASADDDIRVRLR
ncbi:selenide, water dikinase SelD [Pseudohongiella sp.]|uniref:Selenide, water dikinase n=1 Tax=marine sediment metagenome TaxID=412755 RepID=A0A0F9VXS9_9ZZZZ|nr:selenide, water dikinase SelD [Pseudohongiella sp.]HDZ08615.1 selenide, water dikinase SelD [Pseudohongiella sp.]HEA64193.1 selenide, water dikinase SelD [Pseudohongiella sp.]